MPNDLTARKEQPVEEEWARWKRMVDSVLFIRLVELSEGGEKFYDLIRRGNVDPNLLRHEYAFPSRRWDAAVECVRLSFREESAEYLEVLDMMLTEDLVQASEDAVGVVRLPQVIGGQKGAEHRWASQRDKWRKWQEQIEEYMSNHPGYGAYSAACRHFAKKYRVHPDTIRKHTTKPRTTRTCGR